MPFAHVTTNASVDAKAVAAGLSTLLAGALGKPEGYVMCLVTPDAALVFGGSGDPAAYVELKSIGLAESGLKDLSATLCAFLEAECGVSPARTYIEFTDLKRSWFGWNASTF